MSHRKQQVASTLQRAIQQVVARGLNDPRIRGLITVTDVQVPPDLRTATVMISVFPEERQRLTLQGVQDAARYIRREVGELVSMRQVPELNFKLDLSLKRQAEAMAAIAKVAAERDESPEAPEPGDDPADAPAPAEPANPDEPEEPR